MLTGVNKYLTALPILSYVALIFATLELIAFSSGDATLLSIKRK